LVSELHVPEVEYDKWRDDLRAFDQVLGEFVYEGIPLPDDFARYLRCESGLDWLYRDQLNLGKSIGAAGMEWDAYFLEHR